jgi:hypothetical protein
MRRFAGFSIMGAGVWVSAAGSRARPVPTGLRGSSTGLSGSVIGSLALDAVKPAHIKGIRDTVIASNARRGSGKHGPGEAKVLKRKVRRETVSKVLGAMRRLFAAALEDELIELNPAAGVRLPKQRGDDREVVKPRRILLRFTAEQGESL